MFIRGLYATDIRLLDVFSRIRSWYIYIYISFFLLFSFSAFTSAIIHIELITVAPLDSGSVETGKKQFYRERERKTNALAGMSWILAREMRLGSEGKSDNAVGFNIEEIRAIRNMYICICGILYGYEIPGEN